MTHTIPPWSFSTLSSYETCPRKYYVAKVSKQFPDQMNEASIWGDRVHRALEDRLVKRTMLPEGMKQWEDLAKLFDDPGGQLLVEKKLALDQNLNPCAWDKSWVRGIIDVAVLREESGKAYDWKTGKPKRDSVQLMLFAALMMGTFPYLKKVKTGYIWLQDGSMDEATYHRDDLPDIWAEFMPRVQKWENSYKNDKWEMRPSGLCNGYCSNKLCTFYAERKKK